MARNRIPTNPADIAARRAAFNRLRKGIAHADIAKVTGLAVNTVRAYSSPTNPDMAATWTAIEALRAEALKRARKAVAKAEDALFRCEIELQRLERMELPSSAVAGKSYAETAVSVADGQGKALQAARGSASPAPAPAACNRLSLTPVSGQI